MKKTKVYIYGLCNVYYDSYYILGLKEIFHEIEFNVSKFPDFQQGTFACVVCENGNETKIIIDSRDSNEIDIVSLNWCDKYGKVNLNLSTIPSDLKDKIIAIGPSFGIKIWSFTTTIYLSIINFFRFKKNIIDRRDFLANYWRQYKRKPLTDYFPKNNTKRDVFFIGTIWSKEKSTNNFRALFIKSCLMNERINFEGGFAPRNDRNNMGFDDLVYPNRLQLKAYLSKTKDSAFVFNTPAVLSCHGWKLAEFLAMGKAIISTPHVNILPELLIDNYHVLYASNTFEINEKIKLLLDDNTLKTYLQINSRDYFEKNLKPSVVISKLL